MMKNSAMLLGISFGESAVIFLTGLFLNKAGLYTKSTGWMWSVLAGTFVFYILMKCVCRVKEVNAGLINVAISCVPGWVLVCTELVWGDGMTSYFEVIARILLVIGANLILVYCCHIRQNLEKFTWKENVMRVAAAITLLFVVNVLLQYVEVHIWVARLSVIYVMVFVYFWIDRKKCV